MGDTTTDTSKALLVGSDGKTVATDTSNTNRALVNADLGQLQQTAQDRQASHVLLASTVAALADDGMNKRANPTLQKVFCLQQPCNNDQQANDQKINEIAQQLQRSDPSLTDQDARNLAIAQVEGTNSDPNRRIKTNGATNIQTTPITLDDLAALSNDQKMNSTVFINGIYNNPQRAAELAIQQTPTLDPINPSQLAQIQATGNTAVGTTYLVQTNKSNNIFGELIVAGVDKIAEIIGFPTPASQLGAAATKILSNNSSTGLTDNTVYNIGQSRGTMTQSNEFYLLGSEEFYNPNLQIIVNNPAAQGDRLQSRASVITNPANVSIWASLSDTVAQCVGGYGGNCPGSFSSLPSIISTNYSVHSSAGSGAVGSQSRNVSNPFSYSNLNIDELNQARANQTAQNVQQQAQANQNHPASYIAPQPDPSISLQQQIQQQSNTQMAQLVNNADPASAPATASEQQRLQNLRAAMMQGGKP